MSNVTDQIQLCEECLATFPVPSRRREFDQHREVCALPAKRKRSAERELSAGIREQLYPHFTSAQIQAIKNAMLFMARYQAGVDQ